MTKGKMAVVTAGSRGIGRAIVLRLAREGLDLVTCSRDRSKLQSLQADFEALGSQGKLHYIPADLSGQAGVEVFLEFVKSLEGDIDILVNNAGGFVPAKISEEPPGTLESMIELNLYSAYRVTRGLLPHMIARKKGHIFNMCSVASIIPYTQGGSYSIAKFALLGFSKVLREEMKEHQIRVTSILPGPALSDSWQGVDIPPERFMPVEDVAACVADAYQLSSRTVVEEILIRPQLGDIGD